jgi:hypothetical protein
MSESMKLSDLEKICLEARENNKRFTPLEVFEMINTAYTIGFHEGMDRNN